MLDLLVPDPLPPNSAGGGGGKLRLDCRTKLSSRIPGPSTGGWLAGGGGKRWRIQGDGGAGGMVVLEVVLVETVVQHGGGPQWNGANGGKSIWRWRWLVAVAVSKWWSIWNIRVVLVLLCSLSNRSNHQGSKKQLVDLLVSTGGKTYMRLHTLVHLQIQGSPLSNMIVMGWWWLVDKVAGGGGGAGGMVPIEHSWIDASNKCNTCCWNWIS